jgi:predicted RNA binding protein YcfA (HicA-like mRNA interferase family)
MEEIAGAWSSERAFRGCWAVHAALGVSGRDIGHINLAIGYDGSVTWKEVIRKLKAAGFVEKRSGKGSHLLFVHPESGKEIWVTVHRHDAGRLGSRILRDAGVE